jgi:uncharacterized DUF497 family protein
MKGMKITGVIWLRSIVDKLYWKHNLQAGEVEEVFKNRPEYRLLERGKVEGENVYAAYGRANAGRYITIIFIRKAGAKALVISARDMDSKERRQYGR